MIYLLTGDNAYQVQQQLLTVLKDTIGQPRRLDGATLTLNQLPDLLRGTTLFGPAEPVVIRGLFANDTVLQALIDQAEKIDDDRVIILLESKIDKRTKTYKSLLKLAKVIETKQWTEREGRLASEWLRSRAQAASIELSPAQIDDMVRRAHVPSEKPGSFLIDQMRLYSALQALGQGIAVSDDMIDAVMPKAMGETIFDLIAIAAEGNHKRVRAILDDLRAREDAHKVFAITASQWVQLVSVALTSASSNGAQELGIHPFVVQKLSSLARQFTHAELRRLTQLCADIDSGMKLSQFDPWDGVDRLIIGIALRRQLPS